MSRHPIAGMSPTVQVATHLGKIAAALAPPKDIAVLGGAAVAPGTSTAMVPTTPPHPPHKSWHQELKDRAPEMVPYAVGAVAGAMAWKKHRGVGALAGAALTATAYSYFWGEADKKRVLLRLLPEALIIGGAYYGAKRGKTNGGKLAGGVVGAALGGLAGAVALSFIPGSDLYEWRQKKFGQKHGG